MRGKPHIVFDILAVAAIVALFFFAATAAGCCGHSRPPSCVQHPCATDCDDCGCDSERRANGGCGHCCGGCE